jgi:rhodanese-related sulfurtransferase
LDIIETKADELREYDEIVVVCRSGARSGQAKMQLEAMGLKNIENLGPWQNVKC